ncbi:alpha/beta hydrolase family protein [Candidatus Laterigemmans baculatus]|uniref:alpha/beta hydrolase family protein n=1 Tax=Candidatus Laterigemmans baculatus TaxID=2770505 RepID=UPI0013DB2E95|nr:alpha/beta hydrolase [Candidatus Laterigemmans baculatus]
MVHRETHWTIAHTAPRRSQRVSFPGGNGFPLAGIVDAPEEPHPTEPHPAEPHRHSQRPPVVLFSHCFTCNKDLKAIVRISRQLAARGVVVLRYDMTGLGDSGGTFRETNFETNLLDLQAAARFASEQLGPPALLVGHSLGGAASLAAAAEWSADLAPLRGVATLAAPSDTRHLADLLVRMDRRVESEGQGEVVIGGRSWETSRQMIENFRQFDLPGRIARLNVPLLLFHSPTDATVGYDHALRILSLRAAAPDAHRSAENATPPPASLLTLPATDHLLVSHPSDVLFVADAIAVWLQRLLA